MSRRSRLEETRSNFIKMRGGKLISAEAVILGFVIFFIMATAKNGSPYAALVVALVVGFVFPILVGIFKPLAWLAAILFSLVWAFLAFMFAVAITNGLVGLLVGIVFFLISFRVHKNYSGLLFQGISKKDNDLRISSPESISFHEKVSFCPKCGRRIKTSDGHCDICDK